MIGSYGGAISDDYFATREYIREYNKNEFITNKVFLFVHWLNTITDWHDKQCLKGGVKNITMIKITKVVITQKETMSSQRNIAVLITVKAKNIIALNI